jgi:hypothetical protein
MLGLWMELQHRHQRGSSSLFHSYDVSPDGKRFLMIRRDPGAILWCPDPFAGGNRHFDMNNFPRSRPLPENPRHQWVHEFKRRRIDLTALITGLVVSPWATQEVFEKAKQWVQVKNHSYEVRRSNLAIC